MSGAKEKNNTCLQVSWWFMSCLDKYEQSIFIDGFNFPKNLSIISEKQACI